MRGGIFLRVLFAIILVGGLAGMGVLIYNAGVAQGLAVGRSLVAPDSEGLPNPYFYYAPFYRPWGFGLFGLFFPLLLVFLFFIAVRGLFFRGWHHNGPWRWHDPRYYEQGSIPPMLREWHRKMHAAPEEQTSSQE